MGLFTATLVAALAADPAEGQSPTAPPPRRGTDPEAAKHLAAWKKAADGRENFRAVFSLTRWNELERMRDEHSGGVLLAAKPNLFRFRVARDRDSVHDGYEAHICDGKSLFVYDGRAKTVTEVVLEPWPAADLAGPASYERRTKYRFNRMLASANPGEQFAIKWLTGLDPEQYAVSLVPTEKGVIDLEFEPRSEQDQELLLRARVRLAGPDAKTPYAPVEVRVERWDTTVEVWRFADVRAGVLEIDREVFRFEPVPGFKLLTPRRDPARPDR